MQYLPCIFTKMAYNANFLRKNEIVPASLGCYCLHVSTTLKPLIRLLLFGSSKAGDHLLELTYVLTLGTAVWLRQRVRAHPTLSQSLLLLWQRISHKPDLSFLSPSSVWGRGLWTPHAPVVSDWLLSSANNGFLVQSRWLPSLRLRCCRLRDQLFPAILPSRMWLVHDRNTSVFVVIRTCGLSHSINRLQSETRCLLVYQRQSEAGGLDDGNRDSKFDALARRRWHECVRGGRRSVPAVRVDDDAADDVRRAHPARWLHPRDDRAHALWGAGTGATGTSARTAENHLRWTQAAAWPQLQHVRRLSCVKLHLRQDINKQTDNRTTRHVVLTL